MGQSLINVSKYVLDLFGRGSDSQLWDWLTIRPIGWERERENCKQSFWLGPQVECWLVVGSQDSDICINEGFIFLCQWYSNGWSESAEPKSESPHDMLSWYWMLCTELVRPSGKSLWVQVSLELFTPQQTELLHNKSLSHTFHLRILKNSAILFSNYINNSKFVLFKFALGLHTCVYIYSICNVYTCQHVCSKMWKLAPQQITDVCFFF